MSYLSPLLHSEKTAYGSVISFFDFPAEITGREFVALPVIMQAFAAFIFSRARLICAITVQFVFF